MNVWNFEQDSANEGETALRWLAEWVAMPALLATPARPLAEMAEPASRLSEVTREKFTSLLGARQIRQELAERARHGASGTADRLRLRAGDLSRLPDAVLYPRNPEEVLALLKLCAQTGVAVTPFGTGSGFGAMAQRGELAALVTFDLSAMSHLVSVDTLSGLARAEAGITADELARQLAAQGAALAGTMEGTLGGHIARNRQTSWLQAARLATPEGMVASDVSLAPGSQGFFGITTGASVRIRTLPAKTEYRRYLFNDFAGGLTALREAQRLGLIQAGAFLWDGNQTHFHQKMNQSSPQRVISAWLSDIHRRFRQFDQMAGALTIGFSGSESESDALRRRFDALAKRLGALALGSCTPQKTDHRDMLLDRGMAMDAIEAQASWARLPRIYAAMRASLDRAMRADMPREGANGLVLAEVSDAGHDGAKLRLTMIYPRMLGSDVAQAESVRDTGLKMMAELNRPDEPLELTLRLGIKQMLDPKAILNPGIRSL
jgi:alkyldihydroxyacetonephosphate synthase